MPARGTPRRVGTTRARLAERPPAAGDEARGQMLEIQRARLRAGAINAIDELGYGRATVAEITARARVSRRTFYDLFANREACLAAILDDVAAVVEAELAAADLHGLPWRERVRKGLWTILAFLDREPVLARVCVVQALLADQTLLGRRDELLVRLAAVVDEGRLEGSQDAHWSSLTAEGLVGAAFAIVYARILHGGGEPLTGLTSELTGMIVLPYLGPAAARREQRRPAPSSASAGSRVRSGGPQSARDPLGDVSLRITYRTARVLDALAQLGGSGADPSNRQIADHAGIHDPGQISKLLCRLERLGLLANTSGGAHTKGEPNAWVLTAKGQRLAQSVSQHVSQHTPHKRRAA
jgi:AcrR family transcriptional regulator/DNA-binding MarR family transcriptional regulator